MHPTTLALVHHTHAIAVLAGGLLAVAALTGGALVAQTVDYPSSTLASPPQTTFPFYTPGAGSTGQTVRAQFLCSDAFLATQNLAAGLVTRIGFSLAGQAVHDTFLLRAGATSVTALGSDWTLNLPDQRVQRDLSHELLVGGGTQASPVNQWVELELDHPFHWQPGQSIVVDLTTHVATPGVTLGTTIGAGVPRAYNFDYQPGSPATSFTGSGIVFRLVFATNDLVPFGSGCAAPGGTAPTLSSIGSSALGGTPTILAQQTLETTAGGFLLGFSRRTSALGALPLDLGGGCALLVAPDVFVGVPVVPTGGGFGSAGCTLSVPLDPQLTGACVYTQFVQLDPATPAIVPATFSNGGIVVVW